MISLKQSRRLTGWAATSVALCGGIAAHAQGPTVTFTTLYSFTGRGDGSSPDAPPYVSLGGSVFGTTEMGGLECELGGCGVLFRVNAAGEEATIYRFQSGTGGHSPTSNLVPDLQGNLYGTTITGGANASGTVFKLDPSGSENVLLSFDYTNGALPVGIISRDRNGNLYGTGSAGGALDDGVVFRLDEAGNETILHDFTGSPSDGSGPQNGVLVGKDGSVFGTTYFGGNESCLGGCGVVFKISPSGTETILHYFQDTPDGANSESIPILDDAGNLYGTAWLGGAAGVGTIFKIDPEGNQTILYNFAEPGPSGPTGNFIRDRAGNLYGTTAFGGASDNGTVFRLDASGSLLLLHTFTGDDGQGPTGLTVRKAATGVYEFYGTTTYGGVYGFGSVFELAISDGSDFDVE